MYIYVYTFALFSHESVVCLNGSKVESRIVSSPTKPGGGGGGGVAGGGAGQKVKKGGSCEQKSPSLSNGSSLVNNFKVRESTQIIFVFWGKDKLKSLWQYDPEGLSLSVMSSLFRGPSSPAGALLCMQGRSRIAKQSRENISNM